MKDQKYLGRNNLKRFASFRKVRELQANIAPSEGIIDVDLI